MRALEDELRCRLLDRNGKKVILTQAGEQLHVRVRHVIVTYKDGTEDIWTLKGTCMMPKAGPVGQVGWVECQLLDDDKNLKLYRDAPIGSRLTICLRGKIIANLQSAKPFIENWNFAADGDHVVVKFRGAG